MNPEALKIFSMDEKVAIITGGVGFLGMQFAKILSQAGAHIVIFDNRNIVKIAECVEKIMSTSGISAMGFEVDITDKNQVKEAISRTSARFGRIDVLINNAAINPMVGSPEALAQFSPYEDYPLALWDKELAVDLTGAHICIQTVAPYMIRHRSGVIVNVASEVANIASDNRIYGEGKFKSIAYITAKTGILGLTRAWASHLGEHCVRVNAFSPGGMPKAEVPEEFRKRYSSLNMLGRMAEADEYNGAMLFLCSGASSFMTGAQLVMDGGKSSW